MGESYRTIQGTATARIEEKRSEFIASAAFADTEEAALEHLAAVRAANRTANHNVFAYVVRKDDRVRYSDDGEPAKTAGLPVLEVLRHEGLTDLCMVVTRYFGGTLLGTGGLVRAYTSAAQAAVAAAQILTVQLCVDLTLTVDYTMYQRVALLLSDAGAKLAPPEFADRVTLRFTVLAGTEQSLIAGLRELLRGEEPVVGKPYYDPF